jgi:hypothetical protein
LFTKILEPVLLLTTKHWRGFSIPLSREEVRLAESAAPVKVIGWFKSDAAEQRQLVMKSSSRAMGQRFIGPEQSGNLCGTENPYESN